MKLTQEQKREILGDGLRRAMQLHQQGELGDAELMAINLGTARVLDEEGIGPLEPPEEPGE